MRSVRSNDKSIAQGALISLDGKKYRVLDLDEDAIVLVNMSGPIEFLTKPSADFLRLLYDGRASVLKEKDPVSKNLNPEEGRKIIKWQGIIEQLITDMPSYESLFRRGAKNRAKREAADKMNLTMRRLNDLLERYLRSGRNLYSLVDQRAFNQAGHEVQNISRMSMGLDPITEHDGQTDERKETAFERGLEYFNKGITVHMSYEKMKSDCYSVPGMVDGELGLVDDPDADIPSYRSFLAFIHKNIPEASIKEHKTKKKEKANARPHTGNQQSGVTSAGVQYQIDEYEIPVYLVDEETRSRVVGKAILYCIFDSCAQIIVGVYVGFKNNSNSGLFSAMSSLLEPHDGEFARYGVHCTLDTVPSLVMPREFISDCGSEYMSKQCEAMFARHGISIKHAPPGTGSDKGGVENIFRRLQDYLKAELIGYGYIDPDNHERNYDPKKEAVLSIHEMKRIIYTLVVLINTSPIPGYSPTKEMVEAGVETTPEKIWKYLQENDYYALNVTDRTRPIFMFDLLYDLRDLKISRKNGIYYAGHNLFYFSNEDWFYRMLEDPDPKADIRYNPEYIDYVYVRYKSEIHKVPLAVRREQLKTYKGMSWDEYDEFYKKLLNCRNDGMSEARKMTAMQHIDGTVETAKLLQGESDNKVKDIKESRRAEKHMYEHDPEDREYRMYEDLPGGKLGGTEIPEGIQAEMQYSSSEPDDEVLAEYDDDELFGTDGNDNKEGIE